MTIAALLVFASLLAAWLAVPAERRAPRGPVEQPMRELLPEATQTAA
jgi:hypothetical protein